MNTVKTIEKQQSYYGDEPSNLLSSNPESFKNKAIIVGKTSEDNDLLTNAKVVILLKH